MPASSTRRAAGQLAMTSRGQRGFSLIEVLITMLLVSMVVVALVTGLLLLVSTTNSTDERQKAQLALANYAESMRSLEYLPCGSTADYEAAFMAWDDRWEPEGSTTAELTDVRYWHKGPRNGSGDFVEGDGSFEPACHVDGGIEVDDGAQLLTLEVTHRGVVIDTQIVKAAR